MYLPDESTLPSGGEWNDWATSQQQEVLTTEPASEPSSQANGLFLVDPDKVFSSDQGGSQLLGDISRAQWDDWKTRFRPKIEQLADIATDTTLPSQSAAQAQAAVGNSFDNAQRALRLQQQGLGLQLSGAEKATQDRKFGLAETGAAVTAANQARTATHDMQQSVLAGNAGLQNMPSKVLK